MCEECGGADGRRCEVQHQLRSDGLRLVGPTARELIEAELRRVAGVLGHPDVPFQVWRP